MSESYLTDDKIILDGKIENYQKALDEIWDYITKLPKFSQECNCKKEYKEEYDEIETFDTIDYTGDIPNVARWCLKCGGYRYIYEGL